MRWEWQWLGWKIMADTTPKPNEIMHHPPFSCWNFWRYRWNLLATCSVWTYLFVYASEKQRIWPTTHLIKVLYILCSWLQLSSPPVNIHIWGKCLVKSRRNNLLALPRRFFCASWGLIPRAKRPTMRSCCWVGSWFAECKSAWTPGPSSLGAKWLLKGVNSTSLRV